MDDIDEDIEAVYLTSQMESQASVEVFETSAEIHPVPFDVETTNNSPSNCKKIFVKRAKYASNEVTPNNANEKVDDTTEKDSLSEKNVELKAVVVPTLKFDPGSGSSKSVTSFPGSGSSRMGSYSPHVGLNEVLPWQDDQSVDNELVDGSTPSELSLQKNLGPGYYHRYDLSSNNVVFKKLVTLICLLLFCTIHWL